MMSSFRLPGASYRGPRPFLGPLVTLAIIAALAVGRRHGIAVPNPNLLFALALVWSAYDAGIGPGLASAGMALLYTAVAWSLPGRLFQLAGDDRQRLLVALVCMPLMAVLVGLLKARSDRRQRVLESFLDSEKERSRLLLEALDRREAPLGTIPVCAWCHQARNDEGGWESLEAYLDRQHGVMVTHGICPECRQLFDEA